MAEDSPKRRKANFNEAETEVLIEQVLKHEQLLFAAGPGRASPGQKRKVWELIRHKVNPVAACPRDVEDLKKRWRDLKRRDRSKLCRLSQGCGPPGSAAALGLFLAPEEMPPAAAPPARRRHRHRAYGSLLPAEAVPIVGGIDTLELPGAIVGDIGECETEPRRAAPDPPPGVSPAAAAGPTVAVPEGRTALNRLPWQALRTLRAPQGCGSQPHLKMPIPEKCLLSLEMHNVSTHTELGGSCCGSSKWIKTASTSKSCLAVSARLCGTRRSRCLHLCSTDFGKGQESGQCAAVRSAERFEYVTW